MKINDFTVLTDENINPIVVKFLREKGFDVLDVKEAGLIGSGDLELIKKAFSENRLIITQDSDFGTIAIASNEPVSGIIYIRPGHIKPDFTIDILKEIIKKITDIKLPFIIVAERIQNQIKIRIREI